MRAMPVSVPILGLPCVLCLSESHCTHFCSSPVPRPAVFGCYLSLKGLSLVFKGEEEDRMPPVLWFRLSSTCTRFLGFWAVALVLPDHCLSHCGKSAGNLFPLQGVELFFLLFLTFRHCSMFSPLSWVQRCLCPSLHRVAFLPSGKGGSGSRWNILSFLYGRHSCPPYLDHNGYWVLSCVSTWVGFTG